MRNLTYIIQIFDSQKSQAHLFSRSVSHSRLVGGLQELPEPNEELSPPGDRGASDLDVLRWRRGEPGKGGEAQPGPSAPDR